MYITLQYFEDCPHWLTLEDRLKKLIRQHALDAIVRYHLIETPEEAAEHGFRGSPTLLINGTDPFTDGDAPVGFGCRIYSTEAGPAGSPSSRQLEQALWEAEEG